jgi:hypothetical protein
MGKSDVNALALNGLAWIGKQVNRSGKCGYWRRLGDLKLEKTSVDGLQAQGNLELKVRVSLPQIARHLEGILVTDRSRVTGGSKLCSCSSRFDNQHLHGNEHDLSDVHP